MSTSANVRSIESLPAPGGLPLLGNALQMDSKRLHLILEEWSRQHGSVYQLRIGTHRVVAIADPGMIMQVLRDRPDTFRRFRAIETVFADLDLIALFSAEGDAWRRQRRVWMRALNIHQVKPFFDQLVQLTHLLRQRWRQAALQSEAVDVQKDLMHFTFDTIARFAFGHESKSLEGESDELQHMLKRALDAVGHRVSAPVPYWRWFKLPADRRLDRDLSA